MRSAWREGISTGGILYFTGRASRLSSERAIITPTVSPGGAGISFARGF